MLPPQMLGTVSVVNSLSEAPRWIDPVEGNYRLSTNPVSAGINSGSFVAPGGEPSTDIAGNPRIQGSFPDRGAYESTYNDSTTLTVTNTQDSGGGSLRQAILDANSSPLLAKQIKFDIRGGLNVPICPAVIALNTALPAIAAPMSIDGYSQPVSTKNTDADAFNANLCVSVKAASSLPVGFKVLANAPLSVNFGLRGVGMGGFAQPVVLLGGSNHVIAGNQFGGTALGVNLPGAALNAISIGVNAGGSLIVGGNSAVDRNVIVDANLAGINIQSDVVSSIDRCQIVNNLIGLKPDGNSALANSTGISANGEGCGIVRNCIAGNSSAQVLVNGNKNVLQLNQIGVTVNGQGISNLATGVLIRGSGNLVGAPGGSSNLGANTIRFNANGGVVVQGGITASGNSVNGNAIYDNGTAGLAMDIDLQPSGGTPVVTIEGPTANDVGDLDIGPNFLQNYPVAKGLVYTGSNSTNRPATLSGMLDSLPGAQRVDVYFSSAAHPYSRRGHAQQHIGRATVVVDTNGRKFFTLPIAVPNQNVGGVISMTATDSVGNTSEVGNGLATDTLFADGVD